MIGVICLLMTVHMAFVIWYGMMTVMLVVQKYWKLAKYKVIGPVKEPEEEVQAVEVQKEEELKPSRILEKYIKI